MNRAPSSHADITCNALYERAIMAKRRSARAARAIRSIETKRRRARKHEALGYRKGRSSWAFEARLLGGPTTNAWHRRGC